MIITRITRKPVDIPFTVTLTDGSPATPTAVQVALLNRRASPTSGTTWTDATFAGGIVTVTIAGPDAETAGALGVPEAGADLWGKVSDASYVDAVLLLSVRVQGGGSTGLSVHAPRVVPAGGVDGQVLGLVNGELTWVTVTTYPGIAGIS